MKMNPFNETYEPTFGIDIQGLKYRTEKPVIFNFWDTAGKEKYKETHMQYDNRVDAAIIMFSMTNKESFTGASFWSNRIIKSLGYHVPVVFLGNKTDCIRRNLFYSTTMKNVKYFTTSAKTGENYDAILKHLIETIPAKN